MQVEPPDTASTATCNVACMDEPSGAPPRPGANGLVNWLDIPAVLNALLKGQAVTNHRLVELIRMTDGLTDAVAALQAEDAALADAVNAFLANGTAAIQAALDAANATISTLQGQVAQDVVDKAAVQASLDAAQAEIGNAGAAVAAEVSKLQAVQASVTPPVV